MSRNWTTSEITRVKQMYVVDGKSLTEIASLTNRSKASVNYCLRSNCGISSVSEYYNSRMNEESVTTTSVEELKKNNKEELSRIVPKTTTRKRSKRKTQKEFSLLWGAVKAKW